MGIDWSKQHCGVHRADADQLVELMPDLSELIHSLPERPEYFTWDVKVHMLMPQQYPCIPNWHCDHVPRIDNVQQWDQIRLDLPMYLWVSGEPLTEFRRADGSTYKINAQEWVRFSQADEHRGTVSNTFTWRAFVRATHRDIIAPLPGDRTRRHSQVYLDANNFKW